MANPTKQKSRRVAGATSTKARRRAKAAPATPSTRLSGNELKSAVRKFQDETDDKAARQQWKRIEQSIFGVRYDD